MGQIENPNLVSRLARLDVCAVSDALDKLKISGVVTGIPQLAGTGRIAGRVVTVKLGVGQPPSGPVRHLGTAGIEAAEPGDVIVIEQRTGVDAGSWGGILSLGAQLRGIVGVIADGPVRDVDEAEGFGFAIFGRGTTCRTARGRIIEVGTNVPIHVGGVTVEPADYVVADRSGIAFIPARDIERVLEVAEAIVVRETAIAAALRAGEPITRAMGASYENLLK